VFGKKIKLGSEYFVKGTFSDDNTNASKVFVSVNDQQIGYFLIKNSYREGLDEVISSLKPGNELYLLSGDNDSELPALLPLFEDKNRLNFHQSPKEKLHFIENIKKKDNHHVMMIGDGLNDAGALKASDVGITIADDIYHFSPACDGILEAKRFAWLARFISYTKTSMKIVIVSFIISFIYNVVGIYFAVNGYLSPIIAAILMPLSSVTVVAFVTISTSLAAKRAKFDTR
jgi:Cu+-exporting ATPase